MTIKDVARKSGFSVTTVSFVLNDAPLAQRIPNETREHIRTIAAELGYRPNLFARSLRNKRSHMIGVVLFDVTDPYCAQVLRGIETSLDHSNAYLPIITDIQNDQKRFDSYVKMLIERQVAGLIVLANSSNPASELLKLLSECRVPTVIIGREMKRGSLSSVTVANEEGALVALQHLYSLGHRKIAFINGPKRFIESQQRWNGSQRFASETGLTIDRRLVVELKQPNSSYEEGSALARRLVESGKEFTALVSYDDMTAFGAIRALHQLGRKVPDDCSVTGFDDVAAAAYYNPSLTTVRQGMEELGSAAVEFLLKAIEDSTLNKKTTVRSRRIQPHLVVRESTAEPGR
jgi:LacI family transcriptional regulator